MSSAKINPTRNGPYVVTGECELYNESGKLIKNARDGSLHLCRCGASKNKPFCDGSHVRVGFRSSE